MPTAARSFGKINIGLVIGALGPDDYHELRTVYHTIALHDVVKVESRSGTGIEIRSKDPRVPADETNTVYRIADRVCKLVKQRCRLTITIEKALPVRAGLGAASSNAVATMLALERELKVEIEMDDKFRLATEIGMDLPTFLVGGAVIGTGRGEQVYPLPELPELDCVIVTPDVGVSTPAAFAAWDELQERESKSKGSLTGGRNSDKMSSFSRCVDAWLLSTLTQQAPD